MNRPRRPERGGPIPEFTRTRRSALLTLRLREREHRQNFAVS